MLSTAAQPGEERLADRWGTLFIRFVWPIFGLGSVPGFLIARPWSRPRDAGLYLAAAAAFLVMPAYYWLVSRPMRWVWTGPEGLRVSDGRREVRVPYADIADVRGFWYARDLVQVVLKSQTAVGKRFIFIPKLRLVVKGDHPVVNRLREKAGLALR